MRRPFLIGMFLLVTLPALGFGQSLTELAKQEKERRKKIEQSGKQVEVITDRELASNQGRIANPSASAPAAGGEVTEAPAASGSSESSNETNRARVPIRDDTRDDQETQPVTDIPADADLDQKLALLEQMKTSYQQQVANIDAQIQKNNQRLDEIQDQLVSTGGTGLPTAPQADRSVRNPAEIPGLRSEQEDLRQKNQALEAQKQSIKEDIITRARRAGIPSSYLNF